MTPLSGAQPEHARDRLRTGTVRRSVKTRWYRNGRALGVGIGIGIAVGAGLDPDADPDSDPEEEEEESP